MVHKKSNLRLVFERKRHSMTRTDGIICWYCKYGAESIRIPRELSTW